WQQRQQLHVWKDMICSGMRLVIPPEMREVVLEQLHRSHQGITATRLRAQQSVYWPGLSTDISKKISNCLLCHRFASAQQKEPLQPRPVPFGPWQAVAVDFFEYTGKTFLLVVDYFSKYIEVSKVQTVNAIQTMNALKSIFARHGIPSYVFSD